MANEGTPFDDVFRTLLDKCTELIIPVLNEIFGMDYDMSEPIRLAANEHLFTDERGEHRKRITDSYIEIGNRRYHIECESLLNSYIAVRMAEYDFHIALSNVEACSVSK